MNSLPASAVPGKTETERFDYAVREMSAVSIVGMQRPEADWQRLRDRNHGPAKPSKK